MDDFLSRLAGRALGLEPTVQPARAHRYAEGRQVGDQWPNTESIEVPAGERLRPAAPAAAATRLVTVPTKSPGFPVAVSPPPSSLQGGDEAGDSWSSRRRSILQEEDRSPTLMPAVREPRPSARDSAPEKRLADDGLLLPDLQRRGDVAGESSAMPPTAAQFEPARPAPIEPRPPVPDVPSVAERAFPDDQGPQAQTGGVQVSIGKIEIRAVHEPPRAPRPPRRAQSRLGLAEYMDQRNRGER